MQSVTRSCTLLRNNIGITALTSVTSNKFLTSHFPIPERLTFSKGLIQKKSNTKVMAGFQTVPPKAAKEYLDQGYQYLDVRTPEEFLQDHVEGAVNIPVLVKGAGGLEKNPDFVKKVSETFPKDAKLVVACQAGRRSLNAVNQLTEEGYTNLIDLGGGFGAWLQEGLPSRGKI